jgi:hypothetical protein
MKYKYKLVENEESTQGGEETTGGISFREKNDLVLSSKNDEYPLEVILDILKNPKKEYLKGVHVPYSENEKDIKLNIYGFPIIMANTAKNNRLKEEQISKYGKMFYQFVEENVGLKFKQLKKNGFPELNKDNNIVVDKYIDLTKEKGKVSSGIKWKDLEDEAAVKIITDNLSIAEKNIQTILSNAGLKNNIDYSLKRRALSEDLNRLRNIIKEIIEENKINETIDFSLTGKIYDVLVKEVPEVKKKFTKSAFSSFLDNNIK